MQVTLPWPCKSLSPNARVNRHVFAKLKKKYRATCGWECRAQHLESVSAESAHLTITFHPPDRRRRDLDNMLSSIKSGLDGVADVLGIDDGLWDLSLRRGCQKPQGEIILTIEIPETMP